jgi:hypothetical protein
VKLPALIGAHVDERRISDDLPDPPAEFRAGDWQSLDRTLPWALKPTALVGLLLCMDSESAMVAERRGGGLLLSGERSSAVLGAYRGQGPAPLSGLSG